MPTNKFYPLVNVAKDYSCKGVTYNDALHCWRDA